MNIEIRDIEAADHAWMIRANNATDYLPSMSRDSVAALLSLVSLAKIAVIDGAPTGFIIALPPGTGYGCPFYRWFSQTYPDFLYIDRIVLDPPRGDGVTELALCKAAEDSARGGAKRLVAEGMPARVDALRDRLGFEEVHAVQTGGGSRVALMTKTVS